MSQAGLELMILLIWSPKCLHYRLVPLYLALLVRVCGVCVFETGSLCVTLVGVLCLALLCVCVCVRTRVRARMCVGQGLSCVLR